MRATLSVRARVALAATGATLVVTAAAIGTLIGVLSADAHAALDRRLTTQAALLGGPVARLAGRPLGEQTLARIAIPDRVVRILDRAGTPLTALGEGAGSLPLATPPGLATVAGVDGRRWRVLTTPVTPLVGTRVRAATGGTLQVAEDLQVVDEPVSTLRRRALAVGLPTVALAAVAGWGLGGSALRPLTRLRGVADEVASSQDLDVRVPTADQPREVGAVAESMNRMLTRLQASDRARTQALAAARAFSADAAHELRTPLAALAANVETLREQPGLTDQERAAVLAQIDSDQRRLAGTLEALAALARADLASTPTEPVDVGDVVLLEVRAAQRRHPDLSVDTDLPEEDAEVLGSREGLGLLVSNLLDNAARHARRGSHPVHVRVALRRDGAAWLLWIDDDGPGVPERDRARLLGRFERGSTGSPGSGLGLAIAAQQAAAHRGRLWLDDAPGGGLRVAVRLG